ncbi:MAG: ribulose-phosphate 3-epimerase [bacterium]
MTKKIIIAPSILAADFAILGEQIKTAEAAGADWFHLDIMDGHFVPNISFGPLLVEAVRKTTKLPLDVHLMIENPDAYVEAFIEAGADIISVHVEATAHLHRTLNFIKEKGAKAGVAVNPGTPISSLDEALEEADLILAMSVNPGFGGQSFIRSIIRKISRIAEMIERTDRQIYLEVDGGVDSKTTPEIVRAGANVLVAGSAIFGAPNIAATLQEIRNRAGKQ